jgi:hypothetical protein
MSDRGRALTQEQVPNRTHRERKYLGALWARVAFLDARIERERGSYDLQEVAALRWVLEQVGAPAPPKNNERR